MNKNLAKASGGERNHKAAKRVHSRSHSRLQQNKVDTGTVIIFNSSQLDLRIGTTRDTKFFRWINQLGNDSGEEAEKGSVDEEDDDAAVLIDGFGRLDFSDGSKGILLTRISSTWRWETRVSTSIKVSKFWYISIIL